MHEFSSSSWEARQVADISGTEKASEVLRSALYSLQKVEDKSSASFKLTKGLFLHVKGEILWRNRENEKALASLKLALTFSEPLLKEHTDIARCYNAIGNSFFALNQPWKVLEFYEKAYKLQEKLSSEYHFDMLLCTRIRLELHMKALEIMKRQRIVTERH